MTRAGLLSREPADDRRPQDHREGVARYDRDLANQVTRAANSVVLNVAEGRLRQGGDQRRSFQIAAGSCNEVKAGLELAEAWGWARASDDLRSYVERVLAMLWRMTHPR